MCSVKPNCVIKIVYTENVLTELAIVIKAGLEVSVLLRLVQMSVVIMDIVSKENVFAQNFGLVKNVK